MSDAPAAPDVDAASGSSGDPTVSVVVPTYNRRERLQRVLTALAAQRNVGPFEVVVVSDGSTDGTVEYLAGPDVPLAVVALDQPNSGPAVARNAGVERATGELVVFIDDDVVPEPGLIAAHLEAHRRLGPDVVVIGPMLNADDFDYSPWVRWEQAKLATQYEAMDRGDWGATWRQFYTGNASIRREHLVAAGGFDPAFRRAEDVELALRLADAGLEFAFEPGAIGRHYAERSYESWRSIAAAYGRNDVLFSRVGGRSWILDESLDHYGSRHVLVRGVVRVALGRRVLTALADRFLSAVVSLAGRAGGESVEEAALSGVYNLANYGGVAEELGGRREFWRARQRAITTAGSRSEPG